MYIFIKNGVIPAEVYSSLKDGCEAHNIKYYEAKRSIKKFGDVEIKKLVLIKSKGKVKNNPTGEKKRMTPLTVNSNKTPITINGDLVKKAVKLKKDKQVVEVVKPEPVKYNYQRKKAWDLKLMKWVYLD